MRKCTAVQTFDDFVGWATHQTVFSVACNSDSKTPVALQAVEIILRIQTNIPSYYVSLLALCNFAIKPKIGLLLLCKYYIFQYVIVPKTTSV